MLVQNICRLSITKESSYNKLLSMTNDINTYCTDTTIAQSDRLIAIHKKDDNGSIKHQLLLQIAGQKKN